MGAQQKGLLSALAMCPTFDGVFAVGSYGGSLGLYSTQTNGCDCLLQSNGAGPAITHLHYSSTGTQLFVGYRKSPLIKCFDLRMASTGRVLAAFRRDAHTNQRFHFQLDPHDRYLYSGSSGGRVLIYDLKKDQMQSDQMELETLANEEELGRPANWHVNCSEAAVTGLSLHPQEQLVAISTGQRLFPDIMAQLFSADQQCEGNHSPPPSDMEMELADDDEEGEEADGYVGRAKGSALDNSIKLYNMMMP